VDDEVVVGEARRQLASRWRQRVELAHRALVLGAAQRVVRQQRRPRVLPRLLAQRVGADPRLLALLAVRVRATAVVVCALKGQLLVADGGSSVAQRRVLFIVADGRLAQ
jgi:hypothetical protein